MKKILVIMVAVMASLSSFAQNGKKFTFTGQLTDVKDTLEVWAVTIGENDFAKLTDVVTDNGKFTYTADFDKIKQLQFFIPQAQQVANGYRFLVRGIVMAVPGEQLHIEGTVEDYTMSGSALYNDYRDILAIKNKGNEKQDAAYKLYEETIKKDSTKVEEAREALMKVYNEIRQQQANDLIIYIKQNPDKEASAMALADVPTDQLPEALKAMGQSVKDGRMKQLVNSAEQQYKAKVMKDEAKKKVAPGKVAPDFTLNDINGKPFTLSSLRGKYVVLDFWGSWCGWCIKGMPDMKKYYEKYKGKFEIVGIDCNDTADKWKAAVEKHELPWIHVKSEKADAIPQKYAIEGYPTKLIINPDGTINKVVVGEDPQFYDYLDSLFGK